MSYRQSKLEWKDHMMCTRKKRYASHNHALADIRLRKLEGRVRSYGCPVCRGVHLTSARKKRKKQQTKVEQKT